MILNGITGVDIEQLLAIMTLDEKIGQLVQADLSWKEDLQGRIRSGGLGSLFTISNPWVINEYQKMAVNDSRLGIPLIIGNDIIHGYKTILPIPLAQASSWNTDLIEEAETMVTKEALLAGTRWNFAPMVDIARDPRWGRIAESSGEDPLLGRRIAFARVCAYQSDKILAGYKMAACSKHFAAYGAATAGRDYNSVDLSERTLREVYFPPFQAALEAGCKTLMTAFHDLNAIPATANTWLLIDILRNEWGFNGLVVSDFDAIGELIHHGVAANHYQAALLAADAFVDMDMMGNAYPFHLKTLLMEGKVSIKWLDDAVLRVLTLKKELGLFEQPYAHPQEADKVFLCKEHLAIAKKLADESIVLLKNDKFCLPLKTPGKKIAVVGPLANDRCSILGCWRFNGDPDQTETFLEAIRTDFSGAEILYAQGCSVQQHDLNLDAVEQVLDNADLCICILGETDQMSGEAHSLTNLTLAGDQQKLLDFIYNHNLPTVLVVAAGRPLVLTDAVSKADAVLLVWHGGSTAGKALSDTLLGKINPSGKLPVSFPRSVGQIPIFYAHNNTGRPVKSVGTIQFNREHKSKYLDESNDPLFPFGFGLSYANFEVIDPYLDKEAFFANEPILLHVIVRNTSEIAGKTVLQVYIHDVVACVARPVLQLAGFEKIYLAAGEEKRVSLLLDPESLAFYNDRMEKIIEPGEFELYVGFDSNALRIGSFKMI